MNDPQASRRPLVVFGCGGHGRVLAETAVSAGFWCLGFVDDGVAAGTLCDGLPVLGGRDWLCARPPGEFSVALGIGNNAAREAVAHFVRSAGFSLPAVIHRTAVVSPRALVGEGAVVFPLAVINTGSDVAEGVIVNSAAVIEHDVRLGPFSHVSPNATLAGGARIGRRSHVGAGATILPLRTLGDDSTLGAGGVLVKDIPAGVVATGIPARPHRRPLGSV